MNNLLDSSSKTSSLRKSKLSSRNVEVSGNIVDVLHSRIFSGTLKIADGRIRSVYEDHNKYRSFILPGFIDSHIHIESSLLIPSTFARLAVTHGTVGAVCDPHEIGNVLGIEGVRYMIENGKTTPFKFYFGAPPCVPATQFEKAGSEITPRQIDNLFKNDEARFLSEVMNYPAVLNNEPDIMSKIRLAQVYGKPIDGHAPDLRGEKLKKYYQSGISTDHESLDQEEAEEKLALGMKIMIRGGSFSGSLESFLPLIEDYPDQCMFCSDDVHPDDLSKGHINTLVQKALNTKIDQMIVLTCASVNPIHHYGLDVGLLQEGDPADFIEIDNFRDLNILRTFINGVLAAEHGRTRFPKYSARIVNEFNIRKKNPTDFLIRKTGDMMNVIEAIDGQLVTYRRRETPKTQGSNIVSDPEKDLLKITVVNRYRDAPPALGFIKNFGIKKGAVASSVAHDSHNIIAVGVTDSDLCEAVNLIIAYKGGLAVVYDHIKKILPLPVAGIMSDTDGLDVAQQYVKLNRLVKMLGSQLTTPLMTLSFMALLVIPEIKLSDKGLINGKRWQPIGLFD